jgi:hypothetical protein
MAILNAQTAQLPPLPKRTVDVPEMGGEVIVRGLLLSDRLRLAGLVGAGADKEVVAQTLALTVVDEVELPIWTVAEWERFGAVHFPAALKLFKEAQELSGIGLSAEPTATAEGEEKNP